MKGFMIAVAHILLLQYVDLNYNSLGRTTTMDDFFQWIETHASISPCVKIATFPGYGYGLIAECDLKFKDPLFSIPSHIIQTPDKVTSEFSRCMTDFQKTIDRLLSRFSDYSRQDILLALHLMKECSLNGTSHFQPYIDVLPSEAVPRLDTFDDEELILLEDNFLSQLARESMLFLKSLYYNKDFQSIIHNIAKNDEGDDYCTSFQSFHKFITISSSRSMIIDEVKHLVPLADMINHSPRGNTSATYSFQEFHKKSQDGSITIFVDRDFSPGEQIFEDYGPLDSSLFLEAHGFVPPVNIFHCANIESLNLMEFANDIEGMIDLLLHLQLIPTSSSFPDLCIGNDLHIHDRSISNLLSVLALGLDEDKFSTCQRNKTKLSCIDYEYTTVLVPKFLQHIAKRAYCRKTSSLEDDLDLLGSFEHTHHSSIQSMLALRFKIADKHILSNVSGIGPSFNACHVSFH